MATVDKNFRIKNGLVVEGSTATVNGSNILTENSTEFIQDTAAGLITGGTHTNITATYNDSTGTLSLAAGATYSDEQAQDAVGNAVGTGLSYNDTTGAISVDTTAIQAKVANVTDTEIGYLDGVTSGIQTQLDAKAPLASPTFTGTVTLPANTITQSMMADDSVGTNEIVDGAVTSAKIANDTIVNADINSAAAISQSKIDGLTTDLAAKASLSGATFTGAVSGTSLTLSGDLTVNGTTTTINSTEITVDDKNLTLGSVATPTDAGADGGGITLKGATDKTLSWVDATDAWTSSENFNLASGKTYLANGTAIKDVTETLTNKTLTSPALTGTPTAPTAAPGTDTTQVATTAFVKAAADAAAAVANALTTDDVAEGTAQYFTDARARTAVDGTARSFTSVELNSVAKQVAATTGNIVTAAATTAYSWAKSSYRSAEFLVKSKTSTHTEITKIMLTLDSSDNVYLTEYGMSSTSGTSLQAITADISGTDVRIRVTPANANTEILITGTLLV